MLRPGEMISGRYRILHKIGQGGMSVVYLAQDELEGGQWAVKEVRREGVQDFRVVEQGLITETNMLKRFNHPNLPHIIEVIEDEERFLIVMDFVKGISLKDRLDAEGAFLQEDVIRWGRQLCNVLGYLHMQNPPIIYRDLKPANIMLRPDGDIELIDFGTAREYKTGNQEDTINIGTVGYAAPEQYGGRGQSDARTDIYCLGVTLYQLVTGKNPCEPPYLIVPIRHWNPELSPELEKIILKCTELEPEDRYQSCAELDRALDFGRMQGQAGGRKAAKKQGFLSRLLSGGFAKHEKEGRLPQDDVSAFEMPVSGPFLERQVSSQDADYAAMQPEIFEKEDYGNEETVLLAPKEQVTIGKFVLLKDFVDIHTNEMI